MVRLSVNPLTEISERARKRDVRRGWIGKRGKKLGEGRQEGKERKFRRSG